MKLNDKKMRHAKRKRKLGVEKAIREEFETCSIHNLHQWNETKHCKRNGESTKCREMILKVLCKPIGFENNKYCQK